jgi:hypothetical protein
MTSRVARISVSPEQAMTTNCVGIDAAADTTRRPFAEL